MDGFAGEGVASGEVVAVKTHFYGSECLPAYDRAILLLRAPQDAILSEFNRRSSDDHTGLAHPCSFFHHSEYLINLVVGTDPMGAK